MPQRIVLFGPQGSDTVFSDSATVQAIEDTRNCPAAATLLDLCHQAFVQDVQSLAARDPPMSGHDGIDFPLPSSPQDLLSPAVLGSTHPIIEGCRLCLLQLLRYITVASRDAAKPPLSDVIEVAGCCSGLLPAVVVSASGSLEDLITYGVSAFRLAFWIGFHSWLWCLQIEGASETDSTRSLVVKIKQNSDPSLSKTLETSFPRILDAGPADDGWHTFSGPPKDIAAFRNVCVSQLGLTVKLLHIHGCFHGGPALQDSADKVCREALAKGINFPEFKHLKRPLISHTDGEYISAVTHPSRTLLEVIASMLLVRPFDWVATSAKVAQRLNDKVLCNPRDELFLDSVGPGSRMLVEPIKKRTKLRNGNLTVNHLWLPTSSGETQQINANDIAIVGMAVDMPGAPDANQFWDLIQKGLSTVQTIPASRFDVSRVSPNAGAGTGRTMKASQGNFLNDIWSIDMTFFKISPREAKTMDPQQKVLLRTVKTALEDAGYVEDSTPSFQRESFGCFVGVATGDYTDNLRNDIDVYYSPGTLRAFLSGKVSYHYKFSGPSIVTDTACSSSTVAIYQACRALRNGDCSAALAGGVNTISSPDMYLGLDRGHFLNSTGQCKPFDEGADGYSRAEGCSMFVLKRLVDAVAENDRIYAIIKSAEVNQSGCSRSITQPDSSTQASLINKVLRSARVDKNCVDVIEAHGTGTQAGDVSEMRSLHSVFSGSRRSKPIMVSSIKGNIGHCEAASGAAGLAKILLMFRHGQIPEQASLRKINPAIADFVGEKLSVPRKMLSWDRSNGEPRRAILNNFGAAGSNAALLLEEYIPPKESSAQLTTRSAFPFIISAYSNEALKTWCGGLQQWMAEQQGKVTLADICYTATARRSSYERQISMSCKSIPDLLERVAASSIDSVAKPKASNTQLVFVLSGQGGTYLGMGKELMETCPLFRSTVSQCDDILLRHGSPVVSDFLMGNQAALDRLSNTQRLVVTQCASVVLQYALAKLYISWNVTLKCLVGHSLGEFAALALAGVISLEDCLRIAAGRARAVQLLCEPKSSGMLAFRLASSTVEELIEQVGALGRLEIACINSPSDCVVAGPLEDFASLAEICRAKNLKIKMLDVPYGFHSAAMDPVLPELQKLAAPIRCSPATIPVYSTVLGKVLPDVIDAGYFAAHCRQPVRFADAIQDMEARESLEHSAFIEIGPHPITIPLAAASLSVKPRSFSSLRKGTPAWVTLSETLVDLSRTSSSINWRKVFEGTGGKLIDLPGHPFSTVRTGVEYVEPILGKISSPPVDTAPTKYFFCLRKLPVTEQGGPFAFETELSRLGPLITGHKVGGTAMCPASVLSELVYEAAHLAYPTDSNHVWRIQSVKFQQPLIYGGEGDLRKIRVTLQNDKPVTGFTIEFWKDSKHAARFCEGSAELVPVSKLAVDKIRHAALVKRQRQQFTAGRSLDVNFFQQGMLYDSIFARVVEYADDYRSIKSIFTSIDGDEGYGVISFPQDSIKDFVVAPVVSDTLLHAAGFIVNSHTDASSVYICGQMDSMVVLPNLDLQAQYTVYCSLLRTVPDVVLADAFLLDADDNVVAWAEGVHFKRVRLAGFKASLERASKEVFKHIDVKPAATSGTATLLHPPKTADVSIPEHVMPPTEVKIQDTTSSLTRIVADVCGIPQGELDIRKPLDALGVDSMLLLELTSAISAAIPGQSVEFRSLDSSATLQDLIQSVGSQTDGSSYREPAPCLKLSKSTLAAPQLEQSTDEISETLVTTLATVCGISPEAIHGETTLDSLGIDSMMLIELHAALGQKLQTEVTMEALSGCTIIQALQDVLSASATPASTSSSIQVASRHNRPRLLTRSITHSDGSYFKAPCFLFHDGSGFCGMYERLTDIHRPLWGFFSPAWTLDLQPDGGLVEMAKNYAASIETPEGGVILGGWSYGGVVAFEAAHQLIARGVHVKGLVLIDSPLPVNHVALPSAVVDHVLDHSSAFGDMSQASRQSLATNFRHHASLLQAYQPSRTKLGAATKAILLSSRDVLDTDGVCGVPYPWLSDKAEHDKAARGWQQFFEQEISIKSILGTHFEPFLAKNINATSEAFSLALREIDG